MSKYIAPKANTYSLVEFQSKYGSEESCHSTVVGGTGFLCTSASYAATRHPQSPGQS